MMRATTRLLRRQPDLRRVPGAPRRRLSSLDLLMMQVRHRALAHHQVWPVNQNLRQPQRLGIQAKNREQD